MLRLLNAPTDTLDAAIKRGDGYWVLRAEVLAPDDPDPATGDGYTFTTPVAGFAIGPGSEVDIANVSFNFPSGPGSSLQTVTYPVAVGAPIFFRVPPTGIQEGQAAEIDTGRPFEFSGIEPQLTGWNGHLPYLEVIVYFKQPSIAPNIRAPLLIEPVATDIDFEGDATTRVLAINAFGRKSINLAILVTGDQVAAVDGELVGTFAVYQASRVLVDPSTSAFAFNVWPFSELARLTVPYLLQAQPPGIVTAGAYPYQYNIQWEGELRGAEFILIVFEPGTLGASAGTISPFVFAELRD